MKYLLVAFAALLPGCAALMTAALQEDARIRAERNVQRGQWNTLMLELDKEGVEIFPFPYDVKEFEELPALRARWVVLNKQRHADGKPILPMPGLYTDEGWTKYHTPVRYSGSGAGSYSNPRDRAKHKRQRKDPQ